MTPFPYHCGLRVFGVMIVRSKMRCDVLLSGRPTTDMMRHEQPPGK
jgi:hypothetical protein